MSDRLYAFLFRFFYQIRNWRAHARSFVLGTRLAVSRSSAWVTNGLLSVFHPFLGQLHTGGVVCYEGQLDGVLIRADGRRLPLGTLSKRVVTTAGVNYLRDSFAAHASSHDVQNFKYHDSGTGTTAEAIGDTALVTPTGTPSAATAGTQDNSVAKTYKSVATITYSGSLAITEHGLFDGATRATPYILWDRSVFAAVNVASGDSIQFTYTLTINDGG